MTPARKRRLIVASLVLGAGIVAGSLITLALQSNLNYLHSPSEILAGDAPSGGVFRIGGVVLEDSIQSGRIEATREVEYRFEVTDREADYPVIYRGVLPDLFREGQSVIAKGRIEGDVFIADEVLAKHDETYMPAEVADKMTQARMARAQKLKDEAEALKLQGDVPGNQATAADSRDSGAP